MTRRGQHGPRTRDALETTIRRFLGLGAADQLRLHTFATRYLDSAGGPRPSVERKIAAQHAALDCLAKAGRKLQLLEGAAPTVTQYRDVWRRAGASLSATAIVDAFGSWKRATDAYRNGGPLPLNAAQKALIRASIGRDREFDDYCAGVGRFLETSPPSECARDYDAFAAEWNGHLKSGELPLVTSATIRSQTRLAWEEVKAVARGEVTREEALARRGQRSRRRGDFGDYIGLGGVALTLGEGSSGMRSLVRRHGFPPPVVLHGGQRIWWRADIEAYRDGGWTGTRAGVDPPEIVFAGEIRRALGYGESTIRAYVYRSPERLPPIAGRAGGKYYWLRESVDAWCSEHRSNGRSRATSRDDGD